MERSVTHIIETVSPGAGGLICTLIGLFEFQSRKGWRVEIVSRDNLADADALIGQADLVHVHGTTGQVIRQLWPALRTMQKRYVVSTYADKMPRPYQRSMSARIKRRLASLGFQGKLLRKAWCVHALTQSESDQLKRDWGTRRIKVLPMGADPGRRDDRMDSTAEPPHQDKRMVLYLGPLHPGEGLVPFLKVCALAADRFRDLHVVLAGEEQPRWTEMLKAACRRQGFEDRVTLLASPGVEKIEQLLDETVLLVAPIPGECCPVAPLQAMSRGKPVLISPGCNLPEVQLRDAGWIVEPKRRKLQGALHEAFSRNPAALRQMGRNGMAIIKDRYSWDRLGHEYVNLYARVLG